MSTQLSECATRGDPAGPLLVVIHGRGEDEQRSLRISERFDPYGSFHTLAPRAPKKLRTGYSWFATGGEERARATIRQLRERVLAEGEGRDHRASCVIGFSEGAAAALALAYDTDPIDAGCVISIAGFAPRYIALGRTPPLPPVLLMRGTKDRTVGWAQTDRLARTLEQLGADVTLRAFTGAHHIPTDVLLEARVWADETLASS